MTIYSYADVAQSVEHVLGKDKYPVSRATVKNLKKQLNMTPAAMAQSVEHVLGKDGVGSSNLPSSSRKTAQNGRFSFVFLHFLIVKMKGKKCWKLLATFLRHIGYTFFVTIGSRFTVFLLSFRDGLKLPDSTPLATFGYTLATLGYTKFPKKCSHWRF